VAHRIGKREEIGAAVQRLVGDDLVAAQAELSAAGPAEERVHRVRQRLKRVRTLLRVQSPALGERAAEAKRALSSAAWLLASARDADAAAASARGLQAAVAGKEDIGLDRIVAALDRQAEEAHEAVAPIAEVIDRLQAVEADLAASPADFNGAATYNRALLRAYRNGRTAMRRAETSLATPDLHRWRKAVKDLWHLMRLARRRLPARARRASARLAELGDLLGLDHDHAVLAEKLALSPNHDPALMRQLALIAGERRRLESRAFAVGARVYHRVPKEFARAMRLA
jgi:CHAD domain-containing protein